MRRNKTVMPSNAAAAVLSFLSALPMLGGCDPAPPRAPEPAAANTPAPQPVSTSPASSSGDAPQISRSVGVAGGLVVLWPRIVGPRDAVTSASEIARGLQARLAEVAKRAAPGRPIDVRPEPERVCPRAGCAATSVGVLLAVAGSGCAAVLMVSAAGQSPAELVPWGGVVQLQNTSVPFREPPEANVSVGDYVRCESLLQSLNDKDVQAAIARKIR
jgi:hypothetical protein